MNLTRTDIREYVETYLEEKLDELQDKDIDKLVDRVEAYTEKPWWNGECLNNEYMLWLVKSVYGFLAITRGYRNNNPGNIRLTRSKWQGLCTEQKDELFCQFKNIKYGFRAMLKLLSNYYFYHKCYTIRAIIARWAPAEDSNDTKAYIKQVCDLCGLTPAKKLSSPPTDRRLWSEIVVAMAQVENGSNRNGYTENELISYAQDAWDMLKKEDN